MSKPRLVFVLFRAEEGQSFDRLRTNGVKVTPYANAFVNLSSAAFNAALLSDPQDALTRQGENTKHPDCVRFTSAADIPRLAPVIRDLLEQAKAHATAGTLPPKDTSTVALPEELVAALDADPVLAEAFHALTPGRKKSHALAIGSAKASATRAARVVKLTPLILAGKGALDR